MHTRPAACSCCHDMNPRILCGCYVGRATPDHASSRQSATWQLAEAGRYFTAVQSKQYEQAKAEKHWSHRSHIIRQVFQVKTP